ncbi:deoxynucleoside kinase [Candidatus Woesearchaeota archaeon]|nr:deoxynucleoside kinase [Candidatus Woesearchaeota archaeon]
MIIHVSGTQGAGKTSFIKGICEAQPDLYIAYPDRLHFAKVETPVERQVAKMVKFYHELCDQKKYGEEHPGKIVIADRGFYDGIVYGRVFETLGWMTHEQVEAVEQIARLMVAVSEDTFSQLSVVLNPPLDVVLERLTKRWTEKGKKWREGETAYISEAHAEFNRLPSYFRGESILVLQQAKPVCELVENFNEWACTLQGHPDTQAYDAGIDELVAVK